MQSPHKKPPGFFGETELRATTGTLFLLTFFWHDWLEALGSGLGSVLDSNTHGSVGS